MQLKKKESWYPRLLSRKLIVQNSWILPGKNDPHIGVLAAFPGPGWGKSGGKNSFDAKTNGGLLMWRNSAVFWQMGVNLTPVFICTDSDGFTGFPGSDQTIRKRIGSRIGLIFATLTKIPFQSRFPVSYPACFSQTLLHYWLFSLNYRNSGAVAHQQPGSVHLP